ncbi:MAG: FAD binding domain-containing protein [Salinibacterium sp.]|nr:FAD binding domain-containing protein [Salinibacterium sp.]
MDLIYVREARVASTRSALSLAPGEVVIGGGTWLYSEEQPADVTGVVDLMGMGWEPVTRSDDTLVIAATCTVETLRALPDSPLFQQCADSLLASWKIQRIATVGGNIALALPAGPMTALAVALDATLVLWTAESERRVPAAEFVTGVRATILEPGEILRAIEIPLASLHRTAFRRISLSPLGRTGTLVTGRTDTTGTTVFSVTGGTARPHRLAFDAPPAPAEVATAVDSIDDWHLDAHGTPDWRRAMSLVFAEEIRAELS